MCIWGSAWKCRVVNGEGRIISDAGRDWSPHGMFHPTLVQSEKILQDPHPALGGDRLGVELHAPDRQRLVAQAHDFALGRLRGDFEDAREGGTIDDERMVAGGGEVLRQAVEEIAVLVPDGRRLAMHEPRRPDDVAAEIVPNRLVPEADAK